MKAKPTDDEASTEPLLGDKAAAEKLHEAIAAQEAQQPQNAEKLLKQVIDEHPGSDEAGVAQVLRMKLTEAPEESDIGTIPLILLGLGVWVVIIFGVAAAFGAGWARSFWSESWIWVVVIAVVLVAALIFLPWLERKIPNLEEGTKKTVLAFGAIPLIMAALFTAIFLKPEQQEFVFEAVFIVVVCIVPAASYYLFLKTRRPSLLNESIGNLSRLGLLGQRNVHQPGQPGAGGQTTRPESPQERHARIDGYFQRFEALYGQMRFSGPLNRDQFTHALIKAVDQQGAKQPPALWMITLLGRPLASVRIIDIFRANLVIPLGLVTVLSVIGWLLVLQPSWGPFVAPTLEQTDQGSSATGGSEATGTQSEATGAGSMVTTPPSRRPRALRLRVVPRRPVSSR